MAGTYSNLSSMAQDPNGNLLVGTGNPAGEFFVSSNGKLELALDVRYQDGIELAPTGGVDNVFIVDAAKLANVRFAYSVASTESNGALKLSDYDITLKIDTDASAEENFTVFKLVDETPANLADHEFFWEKISGSPKNNAIVDDGGTKAVTQNVQAIQFYGEQKPLIAGGQYEVKLEAASKTGAPLLTSDIRIDVPGDPIYSISAAPATVEEGTTGAGKDVTYTVTRTGNTSAVASVAVSLDGTASVNTDYSVSGIVANRVAFLANSATATFKVTANTDAVIEGNETVVATISDPENAANADFGTIGGASATATITNDDLAPTTPTTGPDTINGTAAAETTNAGFGNDTVAAGGGNDTVNGNEGNDAVNGDDGNDAINGNQGDDAVNGNQGDDFVQGGQGNDFVQGGQGNDSVSGDLGDDTTYGDLGNDTVSGGDGNDTVYGGQGPVTNDAVDGNDSVSGGLGNDFVNGNAGDDAINGNQGADIVQGGQGNDFVQGGQGDDTVSGDLGNDTLSGDLGNDILTGGAGADVFVFAAGSGNDVVTDFDFAQGDRLDFGGRVYTFEAGANGSTEIDFMDGSTIILQGVTADEFNASFVA